MADIGYISLFLALLASIFSAFTFVFGYRWKSPQLVSIAKTSLIATCGLFTLASGILLVALLTHNFQFEYVASYTARDLGLGYLISAFWAGNAGSLLFWGWLLSIFTTLIVVQKRTPGKDLMPYAGAVLMSVQAFLIILMLFATNSNPFQTLASIPADGSGLNPLLQNPGMLIHPVTLLVGYVGFTIPFAFGLSALFTGRLGDEWLMLTRRWTLFAWIALSLGNILGMWWAYNILGWGGYWGWDPVEISSLIPWLTGTALLHSALMQRRRGMLKSWTMSLAIITFLLCIFGTYLTRSGVLQTSVHAWTGETTIGYYFVTFLLITLLVSLAFLWYRRNELKDRAEVETLVSPESSFLLNNLLVVGSAFAVFAGVVYPLVSGWFTGTQSAVDGRFYNEIAGPLLVGVVLLAGICTLIGWRRKPASNLGGNFLWAGVIALGIAVGLFVAGVRQMFALIPFAICTFVLAAIISEYVRGVAARRKAKTETLVTAASGLFTANRTRYGAHIVHIGITLVAVGIISSSMYKSGGTPTTLTQGQQMTVGQYTLTYKSTDTYSTNYQASTKQVDSTLLSVQNGNSSFTMNPDVNYFPSKDAYLQQQSDSNQLTDVSIRTGLWQDLYVILNSVQTDGSAIFTVYINPLIAWLWIGGGVLVLGGVIAYWPGRRTSLATEDSGTERETADVEDEIEKKVRRLRASANQPSATANEDEIERKVRQLRQRKPANIDSDIEKRVSALRAGKTRQFCSQCGTKIEPGDRFCSKCGAKLDGGGRK